MICDTQCRCFKVQQWKVDVISFRKQFKELSRRTFWRSSNPDNSADNCSILPKFSTLMRPIRSGGAPRLRTRTGRRNKLWTSAMLNFFSVATCQRLGGDIFVECSLSVTQLLLVEWEWKRRLADLCNTVRRRFHHVAKHTQQCAPQGLVCYCDKIAAILPAAA